MAEITSLQWKESELLLWVHAVFIVLVAAHLKLLSDWNDEVKVKAVEMVAVGGWTLVESESELGVRGREHISSPACPALPCLYMTLAATLKPLSNSAK